VPGGESFVLHLLDKLCMPKKAITIYKGTNVKVANLLSNQLLPLPHLAAIGPFVLLDHIYPTTLKENQPRTPTGEFAHPHRGIATVSYVLSGSLTHVDSRGNQGIVRAGGLHWLKAGNGILHEEQPFATSEQGSVFHAVQFWINLPALVKQEEPAYVALQAEEVPEIVLPANAGTLRVLVGEFGSTASPLQVFSKQVIFHVRLNPKARFTFLRKVGFDYGALVPSNAVLVNKRVLGNSELTTFTQQDNEIIFENPAIQAADILIFGGEPATEPMVAQGPFVVTSTAEIAAAYKDFFDGKYGKIFYADDN
jgi:redox-sensitive bicupin YhaK (pirin superfamily)